MSNIDWDFISQREGGSRLTGYVPNAEGSKSGVTIATGFDLGARNVSDLKGLSKSLIEKLTPFLGIKGASAQEVAKNLNVTGPEAKSIDELSKKQAVDGLKAKWQAATGESFDSLPKNKATVVASVAFQYGDLESETPNFWRQVTNDDWNAAEKNLRDFGDDYRTRRNLEADYFVGGLSEEELASKKKFEQELARDKQLGIQGAMISGEEGGLGTAPTGPQEVSPRDMSNEELVNLVQGQIEDSRIADKMIDRQPSQPVQMDDTPVEGILTERQEYVTPAADDVELPIITEITEKPNLDPVVSREPSKANSLLPSGDEFFGGYTTLQGKEGVQYGELPPSQVNDPEAYSYTAFDNSFTNVWGTAFRQNNIFPAIAKFIEAEGHKTDPNYDPFKDESLAKRIGGKDGLWRFRFSGSHAESMMMYERMVEDSKDAALLAATESGPAVTFAALASPTTFAPLAPAKLLKAATRTRRFVGGTAYTAALMAPEQMLIDSQNTQRDASHSGMMLTALSLLGGGLAVKFGRPADTGIRLSSSTALVPVGPRQGGSTFTVYRGSGGGGSVQMPTTGSAFGDNTYYALDEGVASMYGKNVDVTEINLVNPVSVSTDQDYVSLMRRFGIDTSFIEKFDNAIAANESFKAIKGRKKLSDQKAFADSYNDFNRSLNAASQELEAALKANGHDGIVVNFGQRNVPKRGRTAKSVSERLDGYRQSNFKFLDNQFDHDQLVKFDGVEVEGDGIFRSAGASASPERARQAAYAQIEQEGLEATGIGIENLGWNPVLRMMQSPNPYVRGLAVTMVDVGGMMQKKVRGSEEAMDQSVETTFRTTYLSRLLDSVRHSDEAYLAYRGRAIPQSDSRRAFEMMKMNLGDTFRGSTELTEVQFRQRIGMAMRRGDADQMNDAASSYITQAAAGYREVFNFIRDQAQSVRLYEKQLAADIAAARQAENMQEVARLEQKMTDLQMMGVTPNTAPSYVPRIYRVDKIMENPEKFLSIIEKYGRTKLRMGDKEAKQFANEVLDTVTHQRPYLDLEGATDGLDWVKRASGVQARTLEIEDELIEEFLESDIETLMRHHVKTMGMDIEIARRYGDVNMQSVLDDVAGEYKKLMDEAPNPEARAELARALERDIRDIRGLRDRLRGTYGASKDPHALSSRAVRVMKSFNVLTGMGSAMISSVPDVARIVMVEGFSNAYRKGFMALFDENAKIIARMSKDELSKAAVGVDATLGLRAHAMSDVGDLFGSRYGLERGLNKATGMFFFFNGLNIWNQALKEMAGNVTMLRMTESIMKPWNKLNAADKEKLLKNGIDQQSHMRMQKLIKDSGEQVNGEWLPNTDAWSDSAMRLKFRNALNQNVERIIITPGAGDRALWTSTEFGSLMTQFKSFGQGAMVRMATAGLQEKDGAFWQGAFMIVGMSAIINEIKRIQYGLDREESYDEKLINAVDRSGILGWAMDVNNAVEKMSDQKMGMRPFLTDQPSYNLPDAAKAGAILGPAASNAMNVGSIMGDIVTFNANAQTMSDLRFSMPTGNLFYLDPIYDGVFGE